MYMHRYVHVPVIGHLSVWRCLCYFSTKLAFRLVTNLLLFTYLFVVLSRSHIDIYVINYSQKSAVARMEAGLN